jgi:hypothetical protein
VDAMNWGLGLRGWGLGVVCMALACGRESVRIEEVRSPSGTEAAADPSLALDPRSGDWLMTWVNSGNLWFARTSDSGATWSAPVRVTDKPDDVHPHGESSPRLVVSPRGTLAAVWTNSIDVPGRAWPASNIRFARSVDGGQTWSRAITLNDDTTGAPGGHIFHGAAWSGDSTLLVAWLDERGGAAPGDSGVEGAHPGHHPETTLEPDATIYLARSLNGGARWGPNQPLWGAACPCCRVSLARGPDGNVVAGWRKHFPGSVRDPVVANVSNGATPPPVTRVATDGWVYPGCPHTGPGVTVDARGTIHVAWFTGKPNGEGVFYGRQPAGAGASFSAPVQVVGGRMTAHPRVAALPDGGAVVATDVESRRYNGLVVARISPDGALRGRRDVASALGADHPDVIALADSTVLVAWTQKEKTDGEARTIVRIARVR